MTDSQHRTNNTNTECVALNGHRVNSDTYHPGQEPEHDPSRSTLGVPLEDHPPTPTSPEAPNTMLLLSVNLCISQITQHAFFFSGSFHSSSLILGNSFTTHSAMALSFRLLESISRHIYTITYSLLMTRGIMSTGLAGMHIYTSVKTSNSFPKHSH